jgi:protein-disulfide isomerase
MSNKHPNSRRIVRMRVSRGVLALFGATVLAVGAAGASGGQTRNHAKAAAETEPGPPEKNLGSRSAPIVLEVFSDYSCPVCRSFYEGSIRPMLDDYIATGKIYLIHRDFPLADATGRPILGHEHSRQAALYVNAAARIGKFQEVDAALYDKQGIWVRDGSVDAVVAAVLSPRDMKRVREMVESGKVDSYVDSDRALGMARGVRSTPTIYMTVHGRTDILPGNVSYSLLKRYFDEQLQR